MKFNIKIAYAQAKEYYRNYSYNSGSNVKYYNFWKDQTPQEMWLTKFIEHNHILNNKTVNFYSVLGPEYNLKKKRKGVNIFFSGENMHSERFKSYRTLCEQVDFDLYIDFDRTIKENSIRFPLWIMYMFKPDSEFEDIQSKVNSLRYPDINERTAFCSIVASHDWNGIRSEIMDGLSAIEKIHSAGNFRKNTNALDLNGNNKHTFIRDYKFNICPENSNAEGYVTEKIFQAIDAGCIPIYWGANNNPEYDILNQDAILFWNQAQDNSKTIRFIRELLVDEKKYIDFVSQDRLLPDAADVIWNYFNNLKQGLNDVINK